MIFILSTTPPTKPGFYWALVAGDHGKDATWQPVEIEDSTTIWIVGSDVPAYVDWVKRWKWGPRLEPPGGPVRETT